ncbi:hypothetical protein QZH41_000872 [Actinostola sp. cb2023]|nr:hypothetical protein QZH41_000872 [Actinostola sp. cb2023]
MREVTLEENEEIKKDSQEVSSVNEAGMEDDDDGEEKEDDDDDDGVEEEVEAKPVKVTKARKPRSFLTGRGVTIAMLIEDGVMEPGEKLLSIDYLGQKFQADLLPDGKIKWPEANKQFNSPSAWAIYCKRLVNPSKKSGCGWASVKYKGRKLDQYKTTWFKKQRTGSTSQENYFTQFNSIVAIPAEQPVIIPYQTIVICHITTHEVAWTFYEESDIRIITVTLQQVKSQDTWPGSGILKLIIRQAVSKRGLQIVGWFHSHPSYQADPSVQDIKSQTKYQMMAQQALGGSHEPVIGMIVSPYDTYKPTKESTFRTFWVMHPPDNPDVLGIPMHLNYTVQQDQFLTQDLLNELRWLWSFYKGSPDAIEFSNTWYGQQTYMDKVKSSLIKKFPT